MSSLFVLVEGQTEEAFVKSVLAPHLAERGVFSHAIVVTTSRELLPPPCSASGGVGGEVVGWLYRAGSAR